MLSYYLLQQYKIIVLTHFWGMLHTQAWSLISEQKYLVSRLNGAVQITASQTNYHTLDKSRQKFHHSLNEHQKISNIPKFRCEML
jgi:hypothetical protein